MELPIYVSAPKPNPKTIMGRRQLANDLDNKFKRWRLMPDDVLIAETENVLPGIKILGATREDCIRLMTMSNVYSMVGGG